MTFSIVACCGETEQLGVAISSSSICIANRCPWVRTKVGAVATQNVTLPSIGPMMLDELETGSNASAALQSVMSADKFSAYRQVIVIDKEGSTAGHNGSKALGINAVASGENCIAAGNLLDNPSIPQAMVDAFLSAPDFDLPRRLLGALQAGSSAGGEAGPVHSSALVVVASQVWPLVDIRIDWSAHDPIAELQVLWYEYEPQMHDYVTRALDPTAAPSYGVPGDE